MTNYGKRKEWAKQWANHPDNRFPRCNHYGPIKTTPTGYYCGKCGIRLKRIKVSK